MVCRPVMDEEEMAFCVVRDFSGTSQDLRVTLNAPPTMTGKEFVREVAKLFNFEPYSFRLVSPTPCKRDNIYQVFDDTRRSLQKLNLNIILLFNKGTNAILFVTVKKCEVVKNNPVR